MLLDYVIFHEQQVRFNEKSELLIFLVVLDCLRHRYHNMKKMLQMQLLQQAMLLLPQQEIDDIEIQIMVDGKMQIKILLVITDQLFV